MTALTGALLAAGGAFLFLQPNHQLWASRHFGERGAAVGFQFNASQSVQDLLGRWKFGVRILYQTGSVTAIHLKDTTLTEADLEHLRNCTEIEILSLDSCEVGVDLIHELPRFRRLNDLALSGLSDEDLATIAKLPSLLILSVDGEGVTDEGLTSIGQLQQLQRLSLMRISVTDAGLPRLYTCSNLTVLDVRNTDVTEAGVEALREKMPAVAVRW